MIRWRGLCCNARMSTRPLTMLLLGGLLACVPAGTAAAQSLDRTSATARYPISVRACSRVHRCRWRTRARSTLPCLNEVLQPRHLPPSRKSRRTPALAPSSGRSARTSMRFPDAAPPTRHPLPLVGAAAAAVHPADDDEPETCRKPTRSRRARAGQGPSARHMSRPAQRSGRI